MALLTVSGEPGSRRDDVARLAAQRLGYELVTEPQLNQWIIEEFGRDTTIPEKAWPYVVASILARFATEHHLVASLPDAEMLFRNLPGVVRVMLIAPEPRRVGNLMIDHRSERPQARALLRELDREARRRRKARFGRAGSPPELFDVLLNSEHLEPSAMVDIIEAVLTARGAKDEGLLSVGAEAQVQFQIRMNLARHGIVPAGRAAIKRASFNHPSEEMFANLLDFYGIQWQYEPRSFPLQWDKEGRVIEAFTPDFYLPEFDLYVELTTMKQTLVTRKNRKIKLLRAIYPHVNIQVFYQKDFQDLVFKYGLPERVAAS